MSSVVIQFLRKCLIKLLALAVRGSDLLLANKFCFSHKAGLYITQIRHVFRFNINRLWQDMLYIYSRICTYYNDLVIETNCICTHLVRIRFLLLPYFFPPMHAHCDILYNAATSVEEYFLIWPIYTFFNFSAIQTLNWIILGTTTHMYRKFTMLHWYHIDSAG